MSESHYPSKHLKLITRIGINQVLWKSPRHMWQIDVTGQFADKPTRGQTSRGLVNSRTSQLAEMFDLKYGVCNSFKCYFG